MTSNMRIGFKWSVNEINSLQREFELLGWDIHQIAAKHRRTPNAIMFKLDQEGLADYNELYAKYNFLTQTPNKTLLSDFDDDVDSDSESYKDTLDDEEYVDEGVDEDDDDDEDDEVANLTERVNGLEDSVSEIKDMLKSLMSSLKKTSSSKLYC